MGFQFLRHEIREQKMLSWASVGLLIFISAFSWSPSRDGLQGIYVLAFFLPILFILLFRKPNFNEYGGWPTLIALMYAGFSTLSTLWGEEPKDFGFFVLQWLVLTTWLCGSCLVFSKYEIDIGKYLRLLVFLGVLLTISNFIYYFIFVKVSSPMQLRLMGWNVFRNPNEIGAFCGIIALLALIIAMQSSLLRDKWLFYALTLISSIGVAATLSRAALFAFLIMAPVTLIAMRPQLKKWLPPIIIAIVVFFLVLSTTNILTFYTAGRGEGLGVRFFIWKEVFARCRENIMTGIGMTKNTNIIIPNLELFNHAHNAWLDTLYRTGLIGLTLILLHLVKILQSFSRHKHLLPLYVWLGYGCICNLFDGRCFFWEIGAKWFLYWIPAGLIVASLSGVSAQKLRTLIKE